MEREIEVQVAAGIDVVVEADEHEVVDGVVEDRRAEGHHPLALVDKGKGGLVGHLPRQFAEELRRELLGLDAHVVVDRLMQPVHLVGQDAVGPFAADHLHHAEP